jgi:hypothetical protein
MDNAMSLPGPSGTCFADKRKRATDWTSGSVIKKSVFIHEESNNEIVIILHYILK